MSHVDAELLPGEVVLYRAGVHWIIYAHSMTWLVLAIATVPAWSFIGRHTGMMFLLAAFVMLVLGLLRAALYDYSTELAVTSKRVIAKFGFIRRATLEMRAANVESIEVDQGLLGRLCGYGSIVMTGSGGTHEPIRYIADATTFRSVALTGLAP